MTTEEVKEILARFSDHCLDMESYEDAEYYANAIQAIEAAEQGMLTIVY